VYDHIRTVFTVHNLKFQGQFAGSLLGDVLGLQDCEAARNQLMQGDSVNFMRGALNYSDRLTTVSPTYAEEVCTDYYGEGLNDVFNRRRGVLSGILNGIDIQHYNPRTSPEMYVRYGPTTVDKKAQNKTCLQTDLGLKVDPTIPILSIISRLTTQKGLDLVDRVMPELMEENLQLVILGVGEKQYEDTFKYYAQKYPEKVSANIYFDEPMSLKLYGCSDMVLVPSQFEPCGLSQMIAMRYGALPIVRETGGLKDSVTPYNEYTGEGNGFTFANYNAHELLYTVQRAVRLFHEDRPGWDGLVQNAFNPDFSWRKSARQYLELYRGVMEGVK
jgi:starch synthase